MGERFTAGDSSSRNLLWEGLWDGFWSWDARVGTADPGQADRSASASSSGRGKERPASWAIGTEERTYREGETVRGPG